MFTILLSVLLVMFLFYWLYFLVTRKKPDDSSVKSSFKHYFIRFLVISVILVFVSMQGQGNIFAWFSEVGYRWVESNLSSVILVFLLLTFTAYLFYFLFYGVLFVFRKFLSKPINTFLSKFFSNNKPKE